ncbi:DUF4253 domain-containing protein [Streptomyces sp. NPDC059072]|uniref:DUF4253 domain-containing protein n=1 Tax=Streptomyces sp. NPDC059072 TaxID=3346715 RepID=UPI003691B957
MVGGLHLRRRRRRHARRRSTPRRHRPLRPELARPRVRPGDGYPSRSTGRRLRAGVPRGPPADTSGAGRRSVRCRGAGGRGLVRALQLRQRHPKFPAVVRNWEDRFGASVVAVGFSTLHLAIAAPPTDRHEALLVAAEHFAFCPDNIWQGSRPCTLAAYAERLIDAPVWEFWWD